MERASVEAGTVRGRESEEVTVRESECLTHCASDCESCFTVLRTLEDCSGDWCTWDPEGYAGKNTAEA